MEMFNVGSTFCVQGETNVMRRARNISRFGERLSLVEKEHNGIISRPMNRTVRYYTRLPTL